MQVQIPARQYVSAVNQVLRAIRLWHKLDNLMVKIPDKKGQEWQAINDTIFQLQGPLHDALNRLVGLSRTAKIARRSADS